MKCPNCGAENEYKYRICQYCGSKMPDLKPDQTTIVNNYYGVTADEVLAAQDKRLHKQRTVTSICAVLLAVTVGAMFATSALDSDLEFGIAFGAFIVALVVFIPQYRKLKRMKKEAEKDQ